MTVQERIEHITSSVSGPEAKIDALLAEAYQNRRADVAFLQSCSEHCLRESHFIGYQKGIGESYCYLGMAYFLSGESLIALEHLDKAVSLFLSSRTMDKLPPDKARIMARSYNLMGLIHADQGEHERAATLFHLGLWISNRIGDKDQAAYIKGNLISVHIDLHQFDEAEELIHTELASFDPGKDMDLIILMEINLGRLYRMQGKLEQAEKLLVKALDYADENKLPYYMAPVADELGVLKMIQGVFSGAEVLLKKSIAIHDESTDFVPRITTRTNLLKLYLEMKEYVAAENLLVEILMLCSKQQAPLVMQDLRLLESRLYEETGREQKALQVLKTYIENQKDVRSGEFMGQTRFLELKRLREFRNLIDQVWLTGTRIACLSDSPQDTDIMFQHLLDLTEAENVQVVIKGEGYLEYRACSKQNGAFHSSTEPDKFYDQFIHLCVENSEEIIIHDLEKEYNLYPDYIREDVPPEHQMRTHLYLPLIFQGVLAGVLAIQYRNLSPVAIDRRISYRLLAQFVTISMINTERLQQLSLDKELYEDAAFHDSLTGLYNRGALEKFFHISYKEAARHSFCCAILMIDIDFFKSINDNFGHITGDRVLESVARVLMETFKRSTDLVCRYGGEEFLILLTDTPREAVLKLAEKVMEKMRNLKIPDGHISPDAGDENQSAKITISIGIGGRCAGDVFPQDMKVLIEEADKALYEAKRTGRDRVVISEY